MIERYALRRTGESSDEFIAGMDWMIVDTWQDRPVAWFPDKVSANVVLDELRGGEVMA